MNSMAWLAARLLALLSVLAFSLTAAAAPKILLRHDLSEPALQALAQLVARFNALQRGRGRVVLEALSAVDDPGQLPRMVLLDRDDRAKFFPGSRLRFKPLYRVMAAAHLGLNARRFLPLIADIVNDPRRRVQALPLGMSMPVLLWNKDLFRKAGLNPEAPPRIWSQVEQAAAKLYNAGDPCPLTSSRFAWVNLENLSSQHGEPITVREPDGATRIVLNRLIEVKHLAVLESWYKSAYFRYFGPGDQGDAKFLSGQCAMLTGASALYNKALHRPFKVGMAPLPYYGDSYNATPGQLLPDGAALWVLAGGSRAEDRLAAHFVAFMLRPSVQRQWVKTTGFLPMTRAALGALEAAGEPPSVLAVVVHRLLERRPADTREMYGYGRDRLHRILDRQIEMVWRNIEPPKQALDDAMLRANLEISEAGRQLSRR